jgi:hypothetical protein
MKPKRIYDLVRGDVYTKKMQIKGREAFVVLNVNPEKNNLTVQSRNFKDPKTIASTNETVYWLRNDPEA